jgi:hypothetical protein
MGHLGVSRDTVVTVGAGYYYFWEMETRDISKYPTMPRTTSHNEKLFDSNCQKCPMNKTILMSLDVASEKGLGLLLCFWKNFPCLHHSLTHPRCLSWALLQPGLLETYISQFSHPTFCRIDTLPFFFSFLYYLSNVYFLFHMISLVPFINSVFISPSFFS